MVATSFSPNFESSRKKAILFSGACWVGIVLTVVHDGFESYLNGHSFYFSESILFGSFWCFFPILWILQHQILKFAKPNLAVRFSTIALTLAIHFLVYPACVWILSAVFFENTFRFGQTFNFAFSQYFSISVLFYAISVFLFPKRKSAEKDATESSPKQKIDFFVVSQNGRQTRILVSEISLITANPPYVTLHHDGKKSLYLQTLKSLSAELDTELFLRVHKSAIVNLDFISSLQSRHNGDYDLTLKNGQNVRLSRNYATDFKSVFFATQDKT